MSLRRIGPCLLLLAPGAQGAQAQAPTQARPLLPEGPAARALAGVGRGTQPHGLALASEHLPGLLAHPDPWSLPATWEHWARWVEAEAELGEPDPSRRAALCLLARAQGRDEDAWAHLAAAGGDPAWVASALPYLWPGIAFDLPAAAGGRPAPLPAGARLAPALPPGAAEVLRGRAPRAELALRGLQVGGGRIDLRLVLEPVGVELELRHAGGADVEVEVLLPIPPGFEAWVDYVDWLRQDEPGAPRRLTVGAGDEEPRQLFARLRPRPEPLPASPRAALPAGLALGGLRLAAREEEREALAAAAAALGRLAGVPAGVRDVRAGRDGAPAFEGVVVGVPDGAAGARVLARVASAAEAWRLAGPAR